VNGWKVEDWNEELSFEDELEKRSQIDAVGNLDALDEA
jgi:hypothetical protein